VINYDCPFNKAGGDGRLGRLIVGVIGEDGVVELRLVRQGGAAEASQDQGQGREQGDQ